MSIRGPPKEGGPQFRVLDYVLTTPRCKNVRRNETFDKASVLD